MILDGLMSFLVGTVTAVLGLFPAWSLPFDVSGSTGALMGAVNNANALFPITVLGSCLGAVLALRGLLVAWSVCVFIYDKIPFKFT